MKFTARGIAAIRAPGMGRVDYWDENMPGFGLRVSSTGARTWVTMYRHKGRKRRHTLGAYPAMTLADAYREARKSLNEAVNGRDPASVKSRERKADTFEYLAAEYMERHAMKHKKRWIFDDRMLKADILEGWKHRKANDISRRDVLKVLDGIVARGAPIQANRVLALIRKIYNFGISRDIVESNPCLAVSMPSKAVSRDRVLNGDEIRLVWASAEQDDPLICGLIKLRLLTAQRGGEVESMAWGDIDLNAGIWTIPAEISKNGLAHRVPLSSQAIEILNQLPSRAAGSPWVFPSPLGSERHIENVQKAIQRVRIRKGFEVDFVGHDLRRTAASHMASIGVSRLVISKILNHVESGVTAVYDRHSYDSEKRVALNLWGDHLQEIMDGMGQMKVISLERVKSLGREEQVSSPIPSRAF